MAQMIERLFSIHLLNRLPLARRSLARSSCHDQVVTGSIPGVGLYGYLFLPSAYLNKQPNGPLRRMCVQAYMRFT